MKHTAPSVQQFIYPRQFSSDSHPIQKSCCHKEPQAVETFDSSAGEAASRSNSFLPSNHGCPIWEYGGYAVTKIRFQPFSITRNHFPSNFLIHYTKRAEPALASAAVCKARKVLLTRAILRSFLCVKNGLSPHPLPPQSAKREGFAHAGDSS